MTRAALHHAVLHPTLFGATLFGATLLGATLLGATLFVAGCGPTGKAYNYPLDATLRLDHLQVKGTHNSYHVEKANNDVKEWHYSHVPLDLQLDKQGVRQIELDLHWVKDDQGDGYHFEIYHVILADDVSTCPTLVECLKTVKSWSDKYPGHLPLYIQMEVKDGFIPALAEAFFTNLESDILRVFPRSRIITPDEVRAGAATLPDALAAGWPTLAKLRGRLFFNFDNRDETRAAYTHGLANLDGRLAFVDSDPSDPFGAISVLNDPIRDQVRIDAAVAAHLLVRTRADVDGDAARANDFSGWDAALASAAHYISTDFPAPVAGTSYFVEMPDGTPARCNPVSAPPSCTSLALEDPRFVGSTP
ncbi:MAG: hypothetical protein JWN44_4790 [Myxococcales bacterium]|nr:hypothetical protein [Myxococcales bacterium]